MKEFLRDLILTSPGPVYSRSLIREYLQSRILESLQQAGAMIPMAFQGGTALRFLYQLARFSEDLDFALERPSPAYDFRAYLRKAQATLSAEGYEVQVRVSDQKTVHAAFIRFPGLFYELKLSPHPDEVLSIKIEVDTNPPQGAELETTIVRRHGLLNLQHHDRASLFAGKLHAVLRRPYPKGRDFYDLMWYLSDPRWPEPNLTLLGNALRQTGWTGSAPGPSTWRALIEDRLRELDWSAVVADVRPFLERPGEADLLTLENLTRLLRAKA